MLDIKNMNETIIKQFHPATVSRLLVEDSPGNPEYIDGNFIIVELKL